MLACHVIGLERINAYNLNPFKRGYHVFEQRSLSNSSKKLAVWSIGFLLLWKAPVGGGGVVICCLKSSKNQLREIAVLGNLEECMMSLNIRRTLIWNCMESLQDLLPGDTAMKISM
ncbi:hypothetical protein TNCV_490211 [Trichonephila clavipes]|nr:hypothetical protein TNCV_490211 [Trichonephila clavipes]